eukprot:PLAT3519.1.p1 GENE.PLAT3519.1~~PLAT3519.1.p1  ORF type:complete len:1164 (-),score=332.47 PLAT3519.1:47-3388(-)
MCGVSAAIPVRTFPRQCAFNVPKHHVGPMDVALLPLRTIWSGATTSAPSRAADLFLLQQLGREAPPRDAPAQDLSVVHLPGPLAKSPLGALVLWSCRAEVPAVSALALQPTGLGALPALNGDVYIAAGTIATIRLPLTPNYARLAAYYNTSVVQVGLFDLGVQQRVTLVSSVWNSSTLRFEDMPTEPASPIALVPVDAPELVAYVGAPLAPQGNFSQTLFPCLLIDGSITARLGRVTLSPIRPGSSSDRFPLGVTPGGKQTLRIDESQTLSLPWLAGDGGKLAYAMQAVDNAAFDLDVITCSPCANGIVSPAAGAKCCGASNVVQVRFAPLDLPLGSERLVKLRYWVLSSAVAAWSYSSEIDLVIQSTPRVRPLIRPPQLTVQEERGILFNVTCELVNTDFGNDAVVGIVVHPPQAGKGELVLATPGITATALAVDDELPYEGKALVFRYFAPDEPPFPPPTMSFLCKLANGINVASTPLRTLITVENINEPPIARPVNLAVQGGAGQSSAVGSTLLDVVDPDDDDVLVCTLTTVEPLLPVESDSDDLQQSRLGRWAVKDAAAEEEEEIELGEPFNCSNSPNLLWSSILDDSDSQAHGGLLWASSGLRLQVTDAAGLSTSTVISVTVSCPGDLHNAVWMTEGAVCQDCPALADCSNGMPECKNGTWSLPELHMCQPCQPRSACFYASFASGSNRSVICAAGYGGIHCATCEPNYFRADGECKQCAGDESLGLVILIGVPLGLLVVFGLLWFVTRGPDINIYHIGVTYFQTLAVLSNFAVNWPKVMLDLVNVLSIFNFNIELIQPECAVPGLTFYSKYKFISFLALALIGLAIVSLPLTYCLLGRSLPSGTVPKPTQRLMSGLASVFSLTYLVVAMTSLSFFDCTSQIDGSFTLDAEPGLACYDQLWFDNLPLAVTMVVLFPFGVPMAIWAAIRLVVPKMERPDDFTLIQPFAAGKEHWIVLILARKLGLVVSKVFFTRFAILQATIALALSGASLSAQLYFKPYKNARLNRMEMLSLSASCVILYMGLLFFSDSFPAEGARDALGLAAAVVIIVVTLLLAVELVQEIRFSLRVKRAVREMAEKRSRAASEGAMEIEMSVVGRPADDADAAAAS